MPATSARTGSRGYLRLVYVVGRFCGSGDGDGKAVHSVRSEAVNTSQ